MNKRKRTHLSTFRSRQEPPAFRAKGGSGIDAKTAHYQSFLKQNPGKWFVWNRKDRYSSSSYSLIERLVGIKIKGIDRSTLPYEATHS
jgi:transposase InsO family protein